MVKQNTFAHRRASKLCDERDARVLDLFRPLTESSGGTLVATGGYGRREMFPYSDLDLCLILPDGGACDETLFARAVRSLWDEGLRVGQVVRTQSQTHDVLKSDVKSLASYLDVRFLCGNEIFFKDILHLLSRTMRTMGPAEFLKIKWNERAQRISDATMSSRSQEPNVKEGRGGLRDYHFLRWMVQAFYPHLDPWPLLSREFNKDTFKRLLTDVNQLFDIRWNLQLAAQRNTDRLGFSEQKAISKKMGIQRRRGLTAAEILMGRHFECAERMAALVEESHFRLGEGAWGRDRIVRRKRSKQNLENLLEVFEQDLERSVLDQSQDLVSHLRGKLTLKEKSLIKYRLGRAFADARVLPGYMRLLDRTNVLSRLFPAWRSVRCRLQHNFLHAYTIDEHLLRAIDEAARIYQTDAKQWPAQLGHLDARTLLLAAWLHDIGKGSSKNHSLLGAQIAKDLIRRIFPGEKTLEDDVVFLVRQHLVLSHTAQRRDPEDPEVIAEFSRLIKDSKRLVHLHALTVADMNATGPKIYSAWKGNLLMSFTLAVLRRLEGESPVRARYEEARQRLVDELRDRNCLSAKDWKQHLRRFPSTYSVLASPDFAVLDDQLLNAARRESVAIGSRPSSYEAAATLIVVAKDRPGLFATIARTISDEGLNIRACRLFTTRDRWAVDWITVDDHSVITRMDRLKLKLKYRLLQDRWSVESEPPQRKLPEAPHPDVPVEIVIDHRASKSMTVIEVYGPDRKGALADVASAISSQGLDIHQAYIATEGARVADIFYVTSARAGKGLGTPRAERKLKAVLNSVLRGQGDFRTVESTAFRKQG